MIVVVADDFTGAAELAGIGLLHGLAVELDIDGAEAKGTSEMLVIATDTRSKGLQEALKEVHTLSENLAAQKPALIYKKIDSVLRGHVLEETQAMLDALDMKGAIIVPANPALERVIIDGTYYVHGEPIQRTSFSEDPEFEIATSSVSELLCRNGSTPSFEIIKPADFDRTGRIVVGEASTLSDLDFWAREASKGWLAVGAAGFFQSILLAIGKPLFPSNHTTEFPRDARTLYLCGSTFQGSRDQVTMASGAGPHVCYMPEDLFWKKEGHEEQLEKWICDVVSLLARHNKAIVAVKQPVIAEPGKSNWIKYNFAVLVKEAFQRTRIEELVIEGGSTASAVLCNMGLTRLTPLHQFQQGVIRMKVENIPGLSLTLKPGSYTWPQTVWKF
jgi:uncharacterized protein YgbK (DUF1537 family)